MKYLQLLKLFKIISQEKNHLWKRGLKNEIMSESVVARMYDVTIGILNNHASHGKKLLYIYCKYKNILIGPYWILKPIMFQAFDVFETFYQAGHESH